MKLTKEQDKLATRLRDAGIPGDFAVLVASRTVNFEDGYAPTKSAVWWIDWFWKQREGAEFWCSFGNCWEYECDARGIK